MTWLVTGCAGFIGSSLVDRLLALDRNVIGIDEFNYFYNPEIKRKNVKKALENEKFVLIADSIECLKFDAAYLSFFKNTKISGIVHLAAYPGVRPSFEKPYVYLDNNIEATLSVLEFARKFEIKNIVFASSSSVYGNCSKIPFEEETILQPISVYGTTKVAGEALCRSYFHAYGMDITCLRFFTCYGPRQRPDLAIRKFSELILKDEYITMYGDGNTSRDYTYIDDIVSGILLAMDKIDGFNIINLGNNFPIKLRDVIEQVGEILEIKPKIIYEDIPKGDVLHTWAAISKAKNFLGWVPKTSFDVGLEKFISWLRKEKC